MTLVIATCTNRKRKPIHRSLHASALPRAPIASLATEWVGRLVNAAELFSVRSIYGGRSFKEALLASELLNAQLMVVSAGLGFVSSDARVPPYACTVLGNAPDSIAARVEGDYSAAGWWQALGEKSPYSQPFQQVMSETDGVICAALSGSYIEMIADDLCGLPPAVLTRLRLFTRAPLDRIPQALRPFAMPYDDRLDGPDSLLGGTRSDFAGRALRHFAEYIATPADMRSAAEHSAAVSIALANWRPAVPIDRTRLDDASLLELIRVHWDSENGSTGRLLRRFRDELGIACEQRRFSDLAHQIRVEFT